MGTTTRPVTHTADVAVKNASTNGADRPLAVAQGAMSRAVKTAMTAANTVTASRAGDCRARRSTISRP